MYNMNSHQMKLWIKFRRTVIEILRQNLLDKNNSLNQFHFSFPQATILVVYTFAALSVDTLNSLILLRHLRKKKPLYQDIRKKHSFSAPNRILIINVVQSIWNCNCSSRLSLQWSTITMVTADSGNQMFCTLYAGLLDWFLNTASYGIMLAGAGSSCEST